jgi:exopolysaccharide biosynthesis polyprenyl glycosylphosphotransferase
MRVFGHHVLASRLKLYVGELAASGVLFLAALAGGGAGGLRSILAALASASALQAALYLADLYDPAVRAEPSRWLRGAGVAALFVAAAGLLLDGAVVGGMLAATGLSLVVVWLLRGLSLHRPIRVLVHGTGSRARVVAQALQAASSECVVVGYLPEPGRDDGLPSPSPLLLDRTGEPDVVARRMGAELLVAAGDGPMPEEALVRARARGVEVVSAAAFCARFTRRLPPELLAPSELVVGEGFFAPRWFDAFERGLDVLAALAILVPASPVLLLAMLAVKIDSPGPVFYRQDRVGRGGRVYPVTKLRSMRVDAEAAGTPVWAGQGDPRVTRVGRLLRVTRLDELPQLLAVLRGDMSLVGPRPERPYFVDKLKGALPLYALREAVRPGVTGWAQISYPYGATLEDARAKLEYDLYFIRHRSPFLALDVLFHTVRTVLTGKGAR